VKSGDVLPLVCTFSPLFVYEDAFGNVALTRVDYLQDGHLQPTLVRLAPADADKLEIFLREKRERDGRA